MPYIHFVGDLPAEKKDYLRDKISEFSKGLSVHRVGEDEVKEMQRSRYELVSRQRAIISRAILSDLDEFSMLVLRMYGIDGISINKSLHHNMHPPINNVKTSEGLIKQIVDFWGLKSTDDLERFKPRKETFVQSHFWGENDHNGLISQAIKDKIDNIIDKHSERFSRNENYYYRIQRAQIDAYSTSDEVEIPELRNIIPGDIISDAGFWSASTEANTAFYRYSNAGENITNFGRSIAEDEQEILFMIENNKNLKAIDVSGFKLRKCHEEFSSGEILIKSASLFKVTAIQLHDPRLDRRIVTLQPIADSDIPAGSTIKDSFTGNIR